MALKGFEQAGSGYQGRPKSRYEQMTEARKAAAQQLMKQAEARSKTSVGKVAEWVPKIIGGVAGGVVGGPAGALKGYQIGSAVGGVAKGVATGDLGDIGEGLAQAPAAYMAGQDLAAMTDAAPAAMSTAKPSLGVGELTLESMEGMPDLSGLSPEELRLYTSLSPDQQRDFLFNKAMAMGFE